MRPNALADAGGDWRVDGITARTAGEPELEVRLKESC